MRRAAPSSKVVSAIERLEQRDPYPALLHLVHLPLHRLHLLLCSSASIELLEAPLAGLQIGEAPLAGLQLGLPRRQRGLPRR